ncbi:hypothetical protein [Ferviditalea candida]|uniref:Uncharacterized protein n=1 Tax=Ferviditalea candida TaxID=3108399 RepID=A0ABU5ZKQ6_9BACL|nr:hypothetical protein [Paenibacillaceae bacterium T2]
MKPIFYSKSPDARAAFIRSYFARSGLKKLAYLVPKKFMPDIAARFPEATLHAYEDVTKSNDLFNLADDQTLLVFDRPSRYKLITNNTFVRLSRIAERYSHKTMVDIVPFTTGIEYLYSPLAFIYRGILGYQHWYSFRENNWELTPAGERIRAHDFRWLAQKLAKAAEIDYSDFLGNHVETIDCPLTRSEASEYKQLRDRLFEENKTASPIITTLADWTNIRESRYEMLEKLLRESGRTVVYTNLSGHNKRLQKRFPGIEVRSFYDTNGGEDQYDRVILFETPIIRGYLFLDVIANVRPDCEIIVFRSDTTVDRLLYKRMFDEYDSINLFSKMLYEEVQHAGRN